MKLRKAASEEEASVHEKENQALKQQVRVTARV